MPSLEDLKSFWGFFRERNQWWMLPLLVTLVLLGSVLVFSESSAFAPLIYTLF